MGELEGVSGHQLTMDCDPIESPFLRWLDIPDSLLLHILSFLPPKDVLTASEVCTKWHRTAMDEMLWKELFTNFFGDTGSNKCFKLASFSSSWLQEFQRLYSETPLIETQVLDKHEDEVLHVTFSHNGKLFASSSKDCFAIIWEVIDGEAKVKRSLDFRKNRWEYVQFCEFSKDDTLLLVSGINERRRLNFMGEITICSIEGKDDQTTMIHNVISEPYDVFGAWLSETHFISGSFEFRVPFYDSSISELWANSICGRNPVRLCRVMNENGSSVRNVLVAKPSYLKENEMLLLFTHGVVTYIPHQIVINKITIEKDNETLRILPDSENSNKNHDVSGKCRVGVDLESDSGNSDDEAEDVGFTEPDRLIETNAHIIGVGLAPEEDKLYVNCRPWMGERKTAQRGVAAAQWGVQEEFEISNDIHTRVYSLSTLELLKEHVGHRAFTPNDKCFFIFLDVANKLVASGAEDCCAHVWDRNYGFKLATLEGHSDVVNCVAFNPQDPEMLVSASDDQTLRVWKSRRKAK